MQKALQTTGLPTLPVIMEDIFQQFQEQAEKIHCAFFQYQVQITPYILPTLVNKVGRLRKGVGKLKRGIEDLKRELSDVKQELVNLKKELIGGPKK